MNRLFYLFSESVKLEAIYLCEDGNYIDKPKLKTGVYPMGTLLSRAIYLLSPWYAENLNLLIKDGIISAALKSSFKYESSFFSITYNDSAVQIIFETLIKNQEYLYTEGRYNNSNKKLKEVLDYIVECLKDISKLSNKMLTQKFNELGYIPPKRNLYYTRKRNEQSTNERCLKNKYFNPNTVRKTKRLFNLPEPQPAENLYGELKLPIYVYEIYDIVDFIASALQCVFEKNYILRKCQLCDSLFVAKDGRTKYCPNQLKNIKSCLELKKRSAQLISENSSESKRVHKNIRTQLANKLGNEDERYKDFLEKSKDYRNKMVQGKTSEEEYIAWMNQYWTDVKAEEWAKKKASKKPESTS